MAAFFVQLGVGVSLIYLRILLQMLWNYSFFQLLPVAGSLTLRLPLLRRLTRGLRLLLLLRLPLRPLFVVVTEGDFGGDAIFLCVVLLINCTFAKIFEKWDLEAFYLLLQSIFLW